jgi:hypothetical protein
VQFLETLRTFNELFKQCFGDAFILMAGVARIRCEQAVREEIGGLMIQIEKGARIENPREYERGAVEGLRVLLEVGVLARRDPRRQNFYEIEGNCETYYIHLSPVSGNVVLLAKWLRQPHDCCLSASPLVA